MNQLLLDFPTMFQTKRLQIRKAFPGDGAEVFEALQSSLTALHPWISYGQQFNNEDDAEADVRESHAKFLLREELRFHLYTKEESLFIGMITLLPINWDIPSLAISFWLASTHQHQGYMTEALDGITKFAFEKLDANRLEVRCDSLNEAANRLAERADFTLEGILQNDRLSVDNSQIRNTCVYAKTKK